MGKGNGGKTVEVYVGAPYNFVPFAKKPYALEPETQVPHNTFLHRCFHNWYPPYQNMQYADGLKYKNRVCFPVNHQDRMLFP